MSIIPWNLVVPYQIDCPFGYPWQSDVFQIKVYFIYLYTWYSSLNIGHLSAWIYFCFGVLSMIVIIVYIFPQYPHSLKVTHNQYTLGKKCLGWIHLPAALLSVVWKQQNSRRMLNSLHAAFQSGNTNIFAFVYHASSLRWCWQLKSSLQEAKNYLSYIINTIAAGYLVKQGTRASAVTLSTLFSLNTLVSAWGGLKWHLTDVCFVRSLILIASL